MFTNQLGYVEFGEHDSFRRDAVVVLDDVNVKSVE